MAQPKCRCHGCGKLFERRDGANLYCSTTCEGDNDKLEAAIADGLKSAGFVRKPESANLWLRDGVAVTATDAKKRGLPAVLKKHARALSEVRNRDGASAVAPAPDSK